MSTNAKTRITLLVVVLCIAAMLGVKFAVTYVQTRDKRESKSARIKGAKNAPLKIVEYIDFQCPACAHGAMYLKDFMVENPDTVRLEMKYYPFRTHRHAFLSSRYAECAARQDLFWSFHDELLKYQSKWSKLPNAKSAFDTMAQYIGLNQALLDQCLVDPELENVIMKDKMDGSALGIRSTPSYVINGQLVVGGRALKDELEKFLNKK